MLNTVIILLYFTNITLNIQITKRAHGCAAANLLAPSCRASLESLLHPEGGLNTPFCQDLRQQSFFLQKKCADKWMRNITLQHTAIRCSTPEHIATNCSSRVTTRCNTLQYTATHGNTLQHTAQQYGSRVTSHYNVLQHNATHCITL